LRRKRYTREASVDHDRLARVDRARNRPEGGDFHSEESDSRSAVTPKTRADMPSNLVRGRRVQAYLGVLSPNDGGSKAGYVGRAADARTVGQRPSRGFHPYENQRSSASSPQRLVALVSWCSFLVWEKGRVGEAFRARRIDQLK
jgi:hypothetical protein